MTSTPRTKRRLVIVSNRLPFTVTQERDSLVFTDSDGGLATGLRTYLDTLGSGGGAFQEYLWIGWPGNTIDPSRQEELIVTARESYHATPVFLAQEEMESFYHGFCNSTIWPLFHYFTAYSMFDESQWEQYIRVNEIFCKSVRQVFREGDVVPDRARHSRAPVVIIESDVAWSHSWVCPSVAADRAVRPRPDRSRRGNDDAVPGA